MFPEAWRTARKLDWPEDLSTHIFITVYIVSSLGVGFERTMGSQFPFPSLPFHSVPFCSLLFFSHPFPSYPSPLCASPLLPSTLSLLPFPSSGLWLASVSAVGRIWPTPRCPHPSTQILPTGCVTRQRVIGVVARIQVLNQAASESGDRLQSARKVPCHLWCRREKELPLGCWRRRREEGGVQSDALFQLVIRRRSQAKDSSQHLGGGKGKGPSSHWGPSR